MRLIDADVFRTEYENLITWVSHRAEKARLREFIKDIQNQPTVEAITIEWLHSIMEKQLIFAMESEMEGTTTVQDGVIHCVSGAVACQVLANVIELWKKENE